MIERNYLEQDLQDLAYTVEDLSDEIYEIGRKIDLLMSVYPKEYVVMRLGKPIKVFINSKMAQEWLESQLTPSKRFKKNSPLKGRVCDVFIKEVPRGLYTNVETNPPT